MISLLVLVVLLSLVAVAPIPRLNRLLAGWRGLAWPALLFALGLFVEYWPGGWRELTLAGAASLAVAGLFLVLGLLAFRLVVPRRASLRFFYHAALMIFLLATALVYPFGAWWSLIAGEAAPAAPGAAATETEYFPGAPLPDGATLSWRYRRLAWACGLDQLELVVVDFPAPWAVVVSWDERAVVRLSTALVAYFDEDELAFALAHELAHYRLRHHRWRLAAGAGALALFFVGAWLLLHLAGAGAGPADWRGEASRFFRLAPLYLTLAALLALGPLALCRAQEREADAFGARLAGPAAAARALAKLAYLYPPDRRERSLWFFYPHPLIHERRAQVKAASFDRSPGQNL